MSANRLAVSATNHCLTGCGIGEVLGEPDALDARLTDLLFWGSLAVSLAVAWGPTFFVNRALIVRGKGHARVHAAHGH